MKIKLNNALTYIDQRLIEEAAGARRLPRHAPEPLKIALPAA